MSEQLKSKQEYEKNPELEKVSHERDAELANERERSAEKSQEQSAEKLQHEAFEKASKAEKEATSDKPVAEKKKDVPLPRAKREKLTFNHNMAEARSHMSAPARAFSKVIHNPAVEKVSEVVGSTVARPNAILSGAVAAFLFTLGFYMIARNLGYPLSGFETIGAFLLGWLVGNLFDYLRLMITGTKV